MLINSVKIKITARELGADLCGIASVASFRNAPEGSKPEDIYNSTKSACNYVRRWKA